MKIKTLFFIAFWLAFVPAQLGVNIESTFVVEQQKITLSIPNPHAEMGILTINQIETPYTTEKESIFFQYVANQAETLNIAWAGKTEEISLNPTPLFWSIVPSMLAILLAIIFKEVLIALFLGILSGVIILNYYKEGYWGIVRAPLQIIGDYVPKTLSDFDHLAIIIFSMLISGTIALISQNGGIKGMVNQITHFAKDAVSTQLTAFFLGIAVFFDEYTNTLVVGNTMRGLAEKMKISREKLAYIVDSTTSPVTSIALITTWIGVELGYITSAIEVVNADHAYKIENSAYTLFINSLPYCFYPVLTLFFVFMLIRMKRDFGPMYDKEIAARKGHIKHENELEEKEDDSIYKTQPNIPIRSINAYIPLFILVFGTLLGLIYTGNKATGAFFNAELSFYEKLYTLIGSSENYVAIISASFCAMFAAAVLTLSQRLLSLPQTIEAITNGMKFMFNSVLILVLAWTISDITKIMHTADFLSSLIESNISVELIPAAIFILAVIIAFSTGTSWGTMGILYPLAIPLVWKITHQAGLNPEEIYPILYNSIACVLTGAVFGDHCSPISDTTILSSLSTSCNHLSHVRTQMPYAITVGAVSLFVGIIPAAFGASLGLLFLLGIVVLFLIIRIVGKSVPS